jgi:hypothetical protein
VVCRQGISTAGHRENAAGCGHGDAKDQEAKRYYEQFGFVTLTSNELILLLRVKAIQHALTPNP